MKYISPVYSVISILKCQTARKVSKFYKFIVTGNCQLIIDISYKMNMSKEQQKYNQIDKKTFTLFRGVQTNKLPAGGESFFIEMGR